MTTIETILSIIGATAGSSVLTAWVTARSARKQVDADAADSVAGSAKLLVETMRIDMKEMKAEIKFIRDENLILQKRIFELEAEVKLYKTLSAAVVPNATIVGPS